MDSSTLSIIGDMEAGQGDVNISIDVASHDISSIGFLNISVIVAGGANDGSVIVSQNNSLNLSSNLSTTVFLNISQLDVGQYTLNLNLYGDVGTPYSNHTDQISQFIKRLAPASPSIGVGNSWTIVPVNGLTGEASGNSSLRDGDLAWVEIPVSNDGEVDWVGQVHLTIYSGGPINQNLTVPPSSTRSTNFSIGPLSEGEQINLTASITGQVVSEIIAVGPPPLARINLSAIPSILTPVLGDEVDWVLNITNDGEANWSGAVQCTFSGSEIILQSITVEASSNHIEEFSLTTRPGELFCGVGGGGRIYDDSQVLFSHLYDMDAAHFSTAGSAGLTIIGSNFHVGDNLLATLIAHNGGDYVGFAKLTISDSSGVSDGALKQFEVGDSRQIDVSHTLSGSEGLRTLSWALVSDDGLVDNNLSGTFEVEVSPSQEMLATISSSTWDLDDGMAVEVVLSLSEGMSRDVTLSIGHGLDGDRVTAIQNDISLTPGARTLNFELGSPVDADELWVEVTPIDWMVSATSEVNESLAISPPDVSPFAILGIANPTVPITGEEATIAYTLTNDGSDTIPVGVLILSSASSKEILWQESAPLVQGGDSQSGSISIDSWPKGNSVDVELSWQHAAGETTTTKSFPSKEPVTNEEMQIPWAATIYGLVAGVVISAIARFVFMWQGEDPEERGRLKAERKVARAKAREEAQERASERKSPTEKREVGCPSCDMTLRIPIEYGGQARCPACTHVFDVKPQKVAESGVDSHQTDEKTVQAKIPKPGLSSNSTDDKTKSSSKPSQSGTKSGANLTTKKSRPKTVSTTPKPVSQDSQSLSSESKDDEIRCPSCAQRLRVPYVKRPITAKCPRCQVKFEAQKG